MSSGYTFEEVTIEDEDDLTYEEVPVSISDDEEDDLLKMLNSIKKQSTNRLNLDSFG